MDNQKLNILIWDYSINIRNCGGPAGYLYNWREFLNKSSDYPNIYFLKDLLHLSNSDQTLHQKYFWGLSIIYKIDLLKIWRRINTIRAAHKWTKKMLSSSIEGINLNDFDIIHFHVSYHLLNAQPLLRNYKGKIVLTTHSPQPLSHEIADGIDCKFSLLRYLIKRRLEKLELAAWSYADFMMFPVKGAVEPYRVTDDFNTYLNSHADKLVYCPTAIADKDIVPNRRIFKERLNIPDDAFVVTYVGRHTSIKGYDQLKLLGERILGKYPNVYFVIGGIENPMTGIAHSHWVELGWINCGAELIAASDMFMLPNRETYFDIVALEVLRTGTPMMMSLTGGNKFFYGLNSDKREGLFFYNYGDLAKQEDILCEMFNKNREEMEDMRKCNMKLFKEQFTMDLFFKRYINLMINIK